MTIQTRIVLWFTVLVIFLVTFTSSISWLELKNQLKHNLEKESRIQTEKVEQRLNSLIAKHPKYQQLSQNQLTLPELEFLLKDILAKVFNTAQVGIDESIYLQVSAADGEILAHSSHLGRARLPIKSVGTMQELPLTLDSGRTIKTHYYTSELIIDDILVGAIQISLSMAESENLIKNLLYTRLLALFISLFLAVLLGFFLSRQTLKPIIALIHEVQSMLKNKRLKRQIDTSQWPPDETGELANTFNALLGLADQLLQAQKRFVSDASHELRTPLTTIQGYAELLAKRGSQNPELIKEATDIIRRETERLVNLIETLLLMARSEKKLLRFQDLEFTELLRQVFAQMLVLHPGLNLASDLPKVILSGDADALKQVLINLLDNAIRATGPQGQIYIRGHCQEQRLILEIEDEGIGIGPEHQALIFERFYRIEDSRTRQTGGSGLGLALVKEIMDQHQGKVKVRSVPGQGSCFILELPLKQAPIFPPLAEQETFFEHPAS